MMAKMFYSLEETKQALGRNEEEIKQLAREGRLREFRDGPRLMFKADQVENLKKELGGGELGDAVSLGPSDTGSPIGLADSRGTSGSGIPLAGGSGAVPSPTKEDTAFADIGLSGSLGGIPSPRSTGPGGSAVSGTGTGTRAGVTIFDVDAGERADPSAQTAISQGISDQVNLEGVGSGSGLLDLTRESDDTSLGAVLQEIAPAPGGTRAGGLPPGDSGIGAGLPLGAAARGGAAVAAAPVFIEEPDASAPAFGAMALAAAIVVFVGLFLLGNVVAGYRPELLETLRGDKSGQSYMLMAFGGVIVFGIVGFIIGKATTK